MATPIITYQDRNITRFYLQKNKKDFIVTCDTDVFEEHISGTTCWYLHKTKRNLRSNYYVRRHVYEDGKEKSCLYLHSLICPARKGFVTDHINGDSLDNRKENLRESCYSLNSKNNKKNGYNVDLNETLSYKNISIAMVTKKVKGNNCFYEYPFYQAYRKNIYMGGGRTLETCKKNIDKKLMQLGENKWATKNKEKMN